MEEPSPQRAYQGEGYAAVRFGGRNDSLSLIHIWEYYIDRLSCHIASTGKQYHSHAATIYKWAQEDAAKGKAAPKQGIPDYSCKEGESL